MDGKKEGRSFKFIFQDYGGHREFTEGEKASWDKIVQENGSYVFKSKYFYEYETDEPLSEIEENSKQLTKIHGNKIVEEAFEILGKVKEIILNDETPIITINNEEDKDKDKSESFPFTIDYPGKNIKTNNHVGVLKCKLGDIEATIEIGSRFDKDDPSQFFLMYLLSKAFEVDMLP